MRRHVKAYWTAQNIVLDYGETGMEVETSRVKIGDGVTAWNSLTYKDGLQWGYTLKTITKAQITANQNDYDLGEENIFRLSSNATRTITGITRGFSGKRIRLFNDGSNRIQLADQSASSTAENRIITGTGTTFRVNAGETVELEYDATESRWRRLM